MTGQNLIDAFKELLGKPYVWGGKSMTEGGYDCSGALYVSANHAGYKLPRWTAQAYSKLGKIIPVGFQKPGDCLFFGSSQYRITHCAVYLGNGLMIESRGSINNTKSNPGKGVVISNVGRRSDLRVVRRWWDETEVNAYEYKINYNYTVQVDHLHVRWSAGGNIKTINETHTGRNETCLCRWLSEKRNCSNL